ncbi:hypothetical protein QAD02_020297 [Eretmocerus hayati]|uniref:Uncharacterized protein n=1 Tax=Eretmocerus hayati TaxID=131215 RepID=A0ACC2PLN3_9HYME|nr:hypothetical protein QAD02_020297 [Eretmocerus hayati]
MSEGNFIAELDGRETENIDTFLRENTKGRGKFSFINSKVILGHGVHLTSDAIRAQVMASLEKKSELVPVFEVKCEKITHDGLFRLIKVNYDQVFQRAGSLNECHKEDHDLASVNVVYFNLPPNSQDLISKIWLIIVDVEKLYAVLHDIFGAINFADKFWAALAASKGHCRSSDSRMTLVPIPDNLHLSVDVKRPKLDHCFEDNCTWFTLDKSRLVLHAKDEHGTVIPARAPKADKYCILCKTYVKNLGQHAQGAARRG